MKRILVAALIGASFPAAAQAMPEGVRECPYGMLPATGFEVQLADALLHTGSNDADPYMNQIGNAVIACATQHDVAEDKIETWFSYVVGETAMPVYAARLKQAKIPTAPILSALEIGPGQANLPLDNMTDADEDRVLAALGKAGVRTENLTEAQQALIGTYAAMAAFYYVGLDRLAD